MIPELGHLALVLALSVALIQATLPLAGARWGLAGWMTVARTAAHGQLLFLFIAFAALVASFVVNDFSVVYVANNSNTALPLPYRIAAIWGAHEGSLLLWALILGVWMVAVARTSHALSLPFISRALAVMGAVNVGFLAFMLLTSNPFLRQFPAPAEGRDLNPLLQDPGLIMHPPMLYMGYVGFSVAFSFAIAALLGGRLDAPWARWSRPWTVMAWIFLTLGITLGSWWAYYELGWGGWWFWDPVENASFMPWLLGTALIHSLAVADKRDAFKRWTCLLAIGTFSLSLLGTFLVRSGVLTSVHAFATDPRRGVFILGILVVTIGGSLLLYARRAPSILDTGRFQPLSREGLLLVNNVLLLVATAVVLLGTLYPLLLDALGLAKISVGPPYFDTVFVPVALALGLALGVGPLCRWKAQGALELWKRLGPAAALALVVGAAVALGLAPARALALAAGLFGALWIALSTALGTRDRLAHRPQLLPALRALPRGFVGMSLAHLGLAVTMVGVTVSTTLGVERDLKLAPGESAEVAGYTFRLEGLSRVSGPNYEADEATVSVWRGERRRTELKPQKRVYRVQQSPMTEAAIDAGVMRDLFVALGERLGPSAWSFRLQYKPCVRWIWLGGILMALGGVIAATDRRYRARPAPAPAARGALAGTTA